MFYDNLAHLHACYPDTRNTFVVGGLVEGNLVNVHRTPSGTFTLHIDDPRYDAPSLSERTLGEMVARYPQFAALFTNEGKADAPKPETLPSPRKERTMKTITIIDLWTDGACSGNPGPATAHWLWKNGVETKGEKTLGECTNNFAELAAIGCGLAAVHNALIAKGKNPADCKIRLRTDSQTALAWLSGSDPSDGVASRDVIVRMVDRIMGELMPRFASVRFIKIAGEENLADPGNKT